MEDILQSSNKTERQKSRQCHGPHVKTKESNRIDEQPCLQQHVPLSSPIPCALPDFSETICRFTAHQAAVTEVVAVVSAVVVLGGSACLALQAQQTTVDEGPQLLHHPALPGLRDRLWEASAAGAGGVDVGAAGAGAVGGAAAGAVAAGSVAAGAVAADAVAAGAVAAGTVASCRRGRHARRRAICKVRRLLPLLLLHWWLLWWTDPGS